MQLIRGKSTERDAAAAKYRKLKGHQKHQWNYRRHQEMGRLCRVYGLG